MVTSVGQLFEREAEWIGGILRNGPKAFQYLTQCLSDLTARTGFAEFDDRVDAIEKRQDRRRSPLAG